MSLSTSETTVWCLRGHIQNFEQVIPLSSGQHRLGSSAQADIRLNVHGVSRRHAVLKMSDAGLAVEDCGSTNGTWIDGVRVERAKVPVGAELRFGPACLRLTAVASEEVELGIDLVDFPTGGDASFAPEESTLTVGREDDSDEDDTTSSVKLPQVLRDLVFPEGYRPGTSATMMRLYEQMGRLRKGDLSVLIHGETGTGKELVARILHNSSDRRQGPFVAVNCAAIPADLLEAEMFGIGKGVATGVEPRAGKFQLAEGGSLFLDEIGEMAPALQAKLLRTLQEKEVHPLGSRAPQKVDVRILAATNVDLEKEMETGALRSDLYYRLAGFLLEVPPLRHRREDIPGLIEHFLRIFAHEAGVRIRGVSVGALRRLNAHAWPGNVRELEHEIRHLAYSGAENFVVTSEQLSKQLRHKEPAADLATRLIGSLDSLELSPVIEAIEERLIREALRRAGGKKVEARRLLGLSRNGLDLKMKRLGITAETGQT